MPLMNINSDWIYNASFGLCINLHCINYLRRVLYFASWGVIVYMTVLYVYVPRNLGVCTILELCRGFLKLL